MNNLKPKRQDRPSIGKNEFYLTLVFLTILVACVIFYRRQNAAILVNQIELIDSTRKQLIEEILKDSSFVVPAYKTDEFDQIIQQRDLQNAAQENVSAAMEQYRTELDHAQSWLEIFLGLFGLITIVFGLIGYWNARETRKDLKEAWDAMNDANKLAAEIRKAHDEVLEQKANAEKISVDLGLLLSTADPSKPLSENLSEKVEEIVKASGPIIEQLKALYYAKGQEAYNEAWESKKSDDWETALRFFDQYLDYDRNNNQLWFMKGCCHYFLEDYSRSVLANSESIKLNQYDANAYTNRGLAYVELGLITEAIEDFNMAIDLNPENADFYTNRGEASHIIGNYEQSINDFTKALSLAPGNSNLFLNLGAVNDIIGNIDEAIELYSKAISLNPNYAEGFNIRGIAYERKSLYKLALSDFSEAIRLNPNYSDAYFNKGLIHDVMGQYENAIKDFDIAIILKPDSPDYYVNRAMTKDSLGLYDDAISDFSNAIALCPNDPDFYWYRGFSKRESGVIDSALSDFSRAIDLKSDKADYYNSRAQVYDERGEFDLAISDYSRAIHLQPDFIDAFNNRGLVRESLQEYQLALEDYNTAINLDPRNSLCITNRGCLYLTMEKYQEAFADFNLAIDINPNDSSAYNNRGFYYEIQSDLISEQKLTLLKLAYDDYKKALEIEPSMEVTRKNLDDIILKLKENGSDQGETLDL